MSQLTSHPDMKHSEPGKYSSPHLASQPHLWLSSGPEHRQGGPKPLFRAVVYPSCFHTPGNISLSYTSREEHNLMRNALPDGSRDYYHFPLFDWMFFWVFLPCQHVILFLCGKNLSFICIVCKFTEISFSLAIYCVSHSMDLFVCLFESLGCVVSRLWLGNNCEVEIFITALQPSVSPVLSYKLSERASRELAEVFSSQNLFTFWKPTQ